LRYVFEGTTFRNDVVFLSLRERERERERVRA
jgi:hypothetical protein